MSNTRLSDRYAKSLYQLAKENGTVETVLADVLLYKDTISKNSNLASVMKSPIIHALKKQEILNQIFFPKFQKLTTLFFKLVLSKGREFELDGVAEAFLHEDKRQKGIKEGVLTTATLPSPEMKADLLKKAEEIAGGKVSITEKIDPNIIGGFILNINGLQLDESVKTKLIKIGDHVLDHSYIPKIDLI